MAKSFDAASSGRELAAPSSSSSSSSSSALHASVGIVKARPPTPQQRSSARKFYAVRLGHRPGIYETWTECLAQVKGFKGALFQSFPTHDEATRFFAGEAIPRRSTTTTGGVTTATPPRRYYAVRRGRVPGIYGDWPAAQKQILGWPRPRHKCFTTLAQAEQFLQETDGEPGTVAVGGGQGEDDDERNGDNNRTVKRVKMDGADLAAYAPGTAPLPLEVEDGFDASLLLAPGTADLAYKSEKQLRATTLQAVGPAPGAMLRVHTDGSALGNGQRGAVAGVGVYFGPGDNRNISEALAGPRQTNQRAELTAIARALDTIPRDRPATIITDSRYSIDCVTRWASGWQRNGWRTAAGRAVENRDLVEGILAKLEDRTGGGVVTRFEWVKGHADQPGNVEADRLAVDGARRG